MRIIFLDYLRIFAFMSVLIGHIYDDVLTRAASDQGLHITLRALAESLMFFSYGGGAGVVVFFLVSGYIITHVLEKESPREFAIKRVFRIYPLYMTATLLWIAIDRETPTWSTIIPQLLLLGDFFKTPYALNEVEWTLRIEVIFYLFMGLTKLFGLLDSGRRSWAFSLLIALTSFLLFILPPLPGPGIVKQGYITLYAPFLFLGSLIYLREKGRVGALSLTAMTTQVFLQYFEGIRNFQPNWLDTHFAFVGFLVFVAGWCLRDRLCPSPFVRWLSDLTFSVYLFHFWLIQWIREAPGIQSLSPSIREGVTLIIFFGCCIFFHQTIERKGIRIGQWFNARWRVDALPQHKSPA